MFYRIIALKHSIKLIHRKKSNMTSFFSKVAIVFSSSLSLLNDCQPRLEDDSPANEIDAIPHQPSRGYFKGLRRSKDLRRIVRHITVYWIWRHKTQFKSEFFCSSIIKFEVDTTPHIFSCEFNKASFCRTLWTAASKHLK